MIRNWCFASAFALVALLGMGTGCDGVSDDPATSQREAIMSACGLDDGTVEHDADVRACDPGDKKKTTICHVPPGNPANAHTLCIGNPAVPHHLANHPDYLGPCQHEIACPPPPPPPPPATGTGGMSGTGGAPQMGTGGGAEIP